MSTKPPAGENSTAEHNAVLSKPHTHKGVSKKAGDTIQVTAEQLVWLKAQGVVGTQEDIKNG